MRSMLGGLLGSTTLILGSALPLSAGAEMPKELMTLYSNMCVSPNSGDLRGERMIVYRTGYKESPDGKEQIWVLHQRSIGLLSAPIFERAAIDGDNIRVVLHFPSLSDFVRTFVGKITPAAISGRHTDSNGSHLVMPLRDTSPENRFPVCN